MKFVTPLSKDEVIEELRCHKVNDIFDYELRSESDNENAVERYGWEMKGFMEKKVMALRVG